MALHAHITYRSGARPLVYVDCPECQGTGLGPLPYDKCFGCKGRGYHTHTVSFDCSCDGCREFRGEIDEDGNEIEREDG
ncbi:MAG: hypothetical protein PHS60_14305 [Zavarzinia sp.]|nr:hypothetical protein [Zavarzinia sp.]